MKKTAAIALLCFLLAAPGWACFEAPLRAQDLPPEFEAVYEVRKANLGAEMRLSFRKGDNRLVYESRISPVGIAALIVGNQEALYRAVFEKTGDRYLPVEFRHEVTGENTKLNEHYAFDWNGHTAQVRYKDKTSILKIPPHTFDTFSMQLFMMRKPAAGNSDRTCSIISRGRLANLEYGLEPDLRIKTKLGSLAVNKVVRKKSGGKNTTYTEWYAESLHYIPVRSEKSRDGKTEFSAHITELRWL